MKKVQDIHPSSVTLHRVVKQSNTASTLDLTRLHHSAAIRLQRFRSQNTNEAVFIKKKTDWAHSCSVSADLLGDNVRIFTAGSERKQMQWSIHTEEVCKRERETPALNDLTRKVLEEGPWAASQTLEESEAHNSDSLQGDITEAPSSVFFLFFFFPIVGVWWWAQFLLPFWAKSRL